MSEEVASQMLEALQEAKEYARSRVLMNEAAPDMLEALELVAKHADQNLCSPYIAKVCAAISKANQ